MPALIQKGDAGLDRAVLIDGVSLSVLPREMNASPEPVSDYQNMLDGGAREWQRRPHFDGVADHADRYTFSFPYDSIRGDDRVTMERMRVRGGIHRLTLWRMVPVIWTCRAGLKRYYFPRFRKCAAHLYAGVTLPGSIIVGTVTFPTEASLNGDALAVSYAEGPALADPGVGGIVIARQPDVDGEALDYTAVLLGDDVAEGDVIELWTCFTFEVSLYSPTFRLSGLVESHSYTFVEI